MTSTLHRLLLACSFAGPSLLAQGTSPTVRCAAVADFVELGGRDTLAISRVVLTDSTFESATHGVTQGAFIRHSGRRTATGELSHLHLEVWPNIADSARAPAQIADVAIQGADVAAVVAAPTRGMQM